MVRQKKTAEQKLRDLEESHQRLAARLANIGPLHNGSVTRQMLTCGSKTCACHSDKSRRHGPYSYWTTKVKGKTVSRRLSPEEADLLEEWINNRRELDKTKKQMIALAREMVPLVLETRGRSEG